MIKNVPEYAWRYPYMVARECDGSDWFWGAYPTAETAEAAAADVQGFVVFNPAHNKK